MDMQVLPVGVYLHRTQAWCPQSLEVTLYSLNLGLWKV